MLNKDLQQIKEILIRIYGEETGTKTFQEIVPLVENFQGRTKRTDDIFSEKEHVLICYGDSLQKADEPPLQTMHHFCKTYFKDIFSTIHFLPFYPYSSDDGFSVMDYHAVRSDLGSWEDISTIQNEFKLMFDLVLNHVSAKSAWFQNYLRGEEGFEALAIEVDPDTDLTRVVRPRALPLLTPFEKKSGERVNLWTTFSADQIDLNFKAPSVLKLMIETLLMYIDKGASVIRLDAIAYLWKEIGTSCIHLRETHEVVKLLRAVLDATAPHVILISETNVPHQENISYFGNGEDEAQLVYNFTLPPLLLYSLIQGGASLLGTWAKTLVLPSKRTTFFNFTASHDGIGVRPLEGILLPSQVDMIADLMKKNRGRVSYKRNPDGTESPYELNITYIDALLRQSEQGDARHIKRFLASQAIQLILPGVPAIYIHSVLGSRNWLEGVEKTGRARTINRESLAVDTLISQIQNPGSFRARVFHAYIDLIRIRRQQPAFHPNAAAEVLELHPNVFALIRKHENQCIYTLTNVSSRVVPVSLSGIDIPPSLTDLLTGKIVGSESIRLEPYQYLWLVAL
jgi:sucrose phosphorylase